MKQLFLDNTPGTPGMEAAMCRVSVNGNAHTVAGTACALFDLKKGGSAHLGY